MDDNEKFKTFLSELGNPNMLKAKLEDIFITEFDTLFENILIKRESEFMHGYTIRLRKIIEDMYSNEAFENIELTKLFKNNTKEVYDKFYKPSYELLSNELKKETNLPTSFNFRRHCRYTEITPFHDCDPNPSENTFRIIKGRDMTYLVCLKCKRSYTSDSVRLYCNFCSLSYYSCLEQGNQGYQPATWEKYHCSAILNDQMRCIKCCNLFYLDLKHDLLVCKTCGFSSDPTSILWVCVVCKRDFTSNAKIYNPLEYKILREVIKEAKLNKTPIFPQHIPCCPEKIRELNLKYFTHKVECNGRIFQGEMQGRQICVCEKCKSVTNYDKFIWTCPLCNKRFRNYSKLASKEVSIQYQSKMSSNKELCYSINNNYSTNPTLIEEEEIDNLTGNMTTNVNIRSMNKRTKPKVSFNEDTNKSAKTNTEACNTSVNSSYQNKTKSCKDLQEINLFSRSCNNIGGGRINGGSNFSTVNPEIYKQTSLEDKRIIRPSDKRRTFQVKEIKNFNKSRTRQDTEEDDMFQIEANPLNVNRNYMKKLTAIDKNPKINLDNIKATSNESYSPYFSSRNEVLIDVDNVSNHNSIDDETENKLQKHNEDSLFIKERRSSVDSDKENSYKSQYLVSVEDKTTKEIEQDMQDHSDNKQEIQIKEEQEQVEKEDETEIQEEENSVEETNDAKVLTIIQIEEINIDDYQIVKQIGEGSFGKIYSVEDKTGQQFAMKKIIANTTQEIDNTRKECCILNSLKHPYIISIKGICAKKLDATTYGIYIVEELGSSDWDKEIKERKKTRKLYTEKELLIILNQLLDALSYMQEYNISHRDIKPQNILCFKDNVYKLSDFGEAKDLHNIGDMCTLRGTELFMSPQLNYSIRTNDSISHNIFKSDTYSLGLCLLYAATLNYNAIYELREILIDYKTVKDFTHYNKKTMSILNTYLKMRYTKGFIDLMTKMLDVDEDKRYDFIELKEELMN